ncbi:MAG: hypothetical protein OEV79_03085 [candidate division WOR-3 bacterium]|nr:hypothetical protein [candidate division WOR-3 bacterium]
MKILLLVGFFESFLFPRSILHEGNFNPAQLHERRFELMAGSEVRYELAELRTYYLHSQVNSFSVRFASFGGELYRENFLELGFGFPLGEQFSAGFNIAGLNSWVRDVSNEFAYAIKVGGQFESAPLVVGVWVNNVNVPRVSSIDYTPVSYSLRLDYLARGNLDFCFSVLGVETELPFYKFGVIFIPHEITLLSLGINTKPITIEYGLKVTFGSMYVFYSGNRHQQLGLTHNVGLGFAR